MTSTAAQRACCSVSVRLLDISRAHQGVGLLPAAGTPSLKSAVLAKIVIFSRGQARWFKKNSFANLIQPEVPVSHRQSEVRVGVRGKLQTSDEASAEKASPWERRVLKQEAVDALESQDGQSKSCAQCRRAKLIVDFQTAPVKCGWPF